MKKYMQVISIALMALLLTSCSGKEQSIPEVKLIPVKSGESFQYIDNDGKIVINPQFSRASVFRDKLALVKTSGSDEKWGFISDDGKFVISANYKRATSFSEDLAWVVSENGVPTAINASGEIKITLQDAQMVEIFSEGLAAFSITDSAGTKWGFVDKDGKTKINPQFSNSGAFHEGKCAVQNSDNKWGYIDLDGKLVINYQFDRAKRFEAGRAVVFAGSKAGAIDENGKYVINPQYTDMVNDRGSFVIEQDGKWGWCDNDGKISINPQFSVAYPFMGSDLAPVQSGRTYGYIDREGKIVINPQFDNALPFSGKIAMVVSNNKVGFIGKDGKYVINPQFDDVPADLGYALSGQNEYSSIETDYFNIGAITDKIKKEITDKSVAGMTFSTPMSAILAKFKKTENDFNRYTTEHTVISREKITNDASFDFIILGNPWQVSGRYEYLFNNSASPAGYAYRINLRGNGRGKEDDAIKSIVNSLAGYTKDAQNSTEYLTVLNSSVQNIRIQNSNGIIIVVLPAASAPSRNIVPAAAPSSGTTTATITGSDVRFRSGPSASASIYFKLDKGATVTVLNRLNGWVNVRYNGREGYVSSDFVSN